MGAPQDWAARADPETAASELPLLPGLGKRFRGARRAAPVGALVKYEELGGRFALREQ